MIWSYILEFENAQNPFGHRRSAINNWKNFCTIDVNETVTLLENARKLLDFGIKAKDALHVAAAMEANADYFLTTDDQLLNKTTQITAVKLMNPTEFVKVLEGYDN